MNDEEEVGDPTKMDVAPKTIDPSKVKKTKPVEQQSGSSGAAAATTYVRVEVPTLPNFSGEGKGTQSSYNLWHYQLTHYIEDLHVSRSSIWQAVHKSVKGLAAEVVMHLGKDVSLETLVAKFDILFGSTKTLEQLLQQFYAAEQSETESITAWGCNLQNLLSDIKKKSGFTYEMLQEMIRNKFWTGLNNKHIKEALRHRYDNNTPFEELLRQARIVESETSHKTSGMSAAQQVESSDKKLDEVLKLVRSFDGRLKNVESRQQKFPEKGTSVSSFKQASAPSDKNRDRFRGRYGVCHRCGDPGHIRPACPELRDHLNH